MDILFRIRGGLDLAFQLAPANGRSDQTKQKPLLFIIKFMMKYTGILFILQMKLRDRMNKLKSYG